MDQRTVYIVDDNRDFLNSAKWWLEGVGYDVEDFDSASAALDALPRHKSNACLLLDVRMPDMSGLSLHDRLREKGVKLPVVYMTGHGDVPLAVEAMRKGAVTFIEKPFEDDVLQSALELAFAPSQQEMSDGAEPPPVSSELQAARDEYMPLYERLTPREREVVGLVMRIRLNKLIADKLGISIKTVELHRKNAMTKLHAKSVIDLTRVLVTLGVS